MISEQAKKIRDSLQPESLSQDYLTKRSDWENAVKNVRTPEGVEISMLSIGGVGCMLHQPPESVFSNKLILYVHGGGFVEGSIQTSREWCARLSLVCSMPVLSVDYRLAPEHPYPAAIDDLYSVYTALEEMWPNRTIASMGADSSGANLLFATLFKLRSMQYVLSDSIFVLSPSIDMLFCGNSFSTNKAIDPLVSVDVLQSYASMYVGEHSRRHPSISPLFGDFTALPPIHIQVDADEILLDDAIGLKLHAERDDCRVELVIGKGLWHVWPTFGDFPEAQEASLRIANHIKEHSP